MSRVFLWRIGMEEVVRIGLELRWKQRGQQDSTRDELKVDMSGIYKKSKKDGVEEEGCVDMYKMEARLEDSLK